MPTFDADYIQRLDQQAKSAQQELDKVDRLGHQTISMSDMMAPSLASTMQGLATGVLEQHGTIMQRAVDKAARPLISTMLQDVTKSMATTHVSSYQNIAGVGLAQHQRAMQQGIADAAKPLMSRFQDVTRLADITQVKSFQDLVPQFVAPQVKSMNWLSTSMLDAQLRPMSKMGESLLQAQLQPLQSLALGLAQPYALRDGPFMAAFHNLDLTFERFNRLAGSSAFGMLQGFQVQQGSLLVNQVAKAVSEAARTSPAWGQLSATLRNYQLRDVWVAPMPREGTATEYSPSSTEPLSDEVQPTHEPSNTEVQNQADEMPFQLNGKWSIFQPLQPVENILHGLWHGPLIVKVLILGPIVGLWNYILIMVIKDGIVYLLHYFC